METPPKQSVENVTMAVARSKSAERQKRYRDRKKQNETKEELLARRQKCAALQRKCVSSLAQCESQNELLSRKRKNADSQIKSKSLKRQRITTKNLFIAREELTNFDEAKIMQCHIGKKDFTCSECSASMFQGEQSGSKGTDKSKSKFTLCCSNGAVKIPPVKDPPEILKKLVTGNTARERNFRTNIRAYNSSLAFASMQVTGTVHKFSSGPYCYRISGQVYHNISQMEPNDGKKPSFSQIYIYDEQSQLENRLGMFSGLDTNVLTKLQNMMKEVNPYAKTYKHLGDIICDKPTQDVQLVLKATGETVDPRRYNLPTGTDIAVIIPTNANNFSSHRDVVIYKNVSLHPEQRSLMYIDTGHPMYDPLMYVLLFPFGDKGYERGNHTAGNRKNDKCSLMQYYRYRLMVRDKDTFNILHRSGRLFQQYVVDMYSKIEGDRLHFIRQNQNKLRAELYQGLADAIKNSDGDVPGTHIGKKVILPSTFTGSARYQHQLYQDAMALVRHFGKPDFFVTFTCNPRWKEITDELFEGQTASDRPDIMARVFKLKLYAFLQDLYYGPMHVLGKMIALIYVIEWQKRGPPHAHILVICDQDSKPRPEEYDSIVSAEIPDHTQFPILHSIVSTLMLHGPCGSSNPNSPCMVDGKCSKKFPKDFVDHTHRAADGYPHYRRRNDGRCVVKNGVSLDNRHVVPYNPYLSTKYNAHINVEICSSIRCCKYLYKYVYKGPDMACVSAQAAPDKHDEISKFVDARFITASEAFWRIFSFDVHGRDPSIQRLAVHEENLQVVTFNEENPEEAIAKSKDTTLLAWFIPNHSDPDAKHLKYHEVPEFYVWNPKCHKWTPRKRGRCIGRIYTTNPGQGERHFLRMLLYHIPGSISYADLKTTPDGTVHSTFKATAIALGLLDNDEEWDECMSEASVSFMPKQLRSLFITVLIFGEPAEPIKLWEKHKESMGQDVMRESMQLNQEGNEMLQRKVDNEILILLASELEAMGTCLENFGLPAPDMYNRIQKIPRVIQEEMFDEDAQRQASETKCSSLNKDQRAAFDSIMKAVNDAEHPQRLFFINAPGGYGKTFLFEALLSTVRGNGQIALAVASSGIAAELLEGGRTAHSRFKIPIPVHESSVCGISLQSNDAKLLRKTAIVIWDEVMMCHVHQLDCVDRSLRDILKMDKPFGGLVVVLGGDPRQILPVVRHGRRPQIVQACVQSSHLWGKVHKMDLTTNMRLNRNEMEFASYLLTVGNGDAELYPEEGEDIIKISRDFLVCTMDELIDKVFPNIEDGYVDQYFVSKRAILTPKNEGVDNINEVVMAKFPGTGTTYLSADTVAEESLQTAYPIDFLNSITLSGMPPHSMTLKPGAPVILLRNLRAGPGNGLRNGTRLIVQKLGCRVIELKIASGVNKGKCVLLPRITIAPSDSELPFTLKRRQFPIRPCFAMSTNKAQGQTLDYVGIYLPDNVFSHGQLYVALSRVRSASSVAVFVNNCEGFTRNIVYKEVL